VNLPARTEASLIPAMSETAVDAVRELERINLQAEQVPITTYHLIHAGMYARSIKLPAGVRLTGVLIKRATVLILNGDVEMFNGREVVRLTGYCVLGGSAHRKQAFYALADTHMTMLFPTSAKDVEAAEDEFTDEADRLFSRRGENIVTITECES
jgi:hypothetical protein